MVGLLRIDFHLSLGFGSLFWTQSGRCVLPLQYQDKNKDDDDDEDVDDKDDDDAIYNDDDEAWEPCRRCVGPEHILNLIVDHVNDLLHLLKQIRSDHLCSTVLNRFTSCALTIFGIEDTYKACYTIQTTL